MTYRWCEVRFFPLYFSYQQQYRGRSQTGQFKPKITESAASLAGAINWNVLGQGYLINCPQSALKKKDQENAGEMSA